MDNVAFVVFGIVLVILGIAAAVYAPSLEQVSDNIANIPEDSKWNNSPSISGYLPWILIIVGSILVVVPVMSKISIL
ncbi:MAG: hypothetical protein PHF76_11530 [Bacteroidales bacterium]|jgi:uncharacterized membrane protein YidH (DUF202 family)|nr:hypothetical protein [Bacteroidales bacterium]